MNAFSSSHARPQRRAAAHGPVLNGLRPPHVKILFISQDGELKFCMHIAHTKTNTMIYICVGVTPLRAAKRPLNAAEGGAA